MDSLQGRVMNWFNLVFATNEFGQVFDHVGSMFVLRSVQRMMVLGSSPKNSSLSLPRGLGTVDRRISHIHLSW